MAVFYFNRTAGHFAEKCCPQFYFSDNLYQMSAVLCRFIFTFYSDV